jgi:HD-like signal output (HDOD) protein
MQAHQWSWGINQWVEYLRDKETPVLPTTHATLLALNQAGEEARESLSARDLVDIVYGDPYLALKLLRRAEERRTRQLGHDTTTPLGAVLQTGYDELQDIVAASRLSEGMLPGCHACERRAVLAATLARAWAAQRVDVVPDEVAMAALLAETGELLLWHFAPEMTDKEVAIYQWNERYWALQHRPSEIEFTFRQLTMALAESWSLPHLIIMLIKGTDTPRANLARLGHDAAKLVIGEAAPEELVRLLQEVQKMLPAQALATLAEPLPLSEPQRERLLAAIVAAEQQVSGAQSSVPSAD